MVLVGRGSSDPDASSDLYKFARLLATTGAADWSSRRSPASRSRTSRRAGALPAARREAIAVVPFFLFTGVLVPRIYAQAEEYAAQHPGLDVRRRPRTWGPTGGSPGSCSSATARCCRATCG